MIVSMATDSPCKDCSERSYNCHSSCERYRQYKDKLEETRAKINAYNAEVAFGKSVKRRVAKRHSKHSKEGR